MLQSARGPLPNLAEHIAGEPIHGSWWGHPCGREIFAVLNRLLDCGDVVATRLVEGRITLIHRRVWPALVRVADRFPAERLAAVEEEHTASGAHRTVEVAFPGWVPAEDHAAATIAHRRRGARSAAELPALSHHGRDRAASSIGSILARVVMLPAAPRRAARHNLGASGSRVDSRMPASLGRTRRQSGRLRGVYP